MLNVIYKLASSVIANRLKTVLNRIINEDQKCFISRRFIGESIRLIYDILFETKEQNIPGLLLSIDFQQAFDSVSCKFISKTLDYFNFGPSFKNGLIFFKTGLNRVYSKTDFFLSFSIYKEGADRVTQYPHIFLPFVPKF